MVDLMLGNADNAFSSGEASFWFRPRKIKNFRPQCRCGLARCPVWEQIGSVPERRFHRTVLKEMGVDYVIDSSKEIGWVIDSQEWAVADGIKTFNLLLWKDPIGLAYSHWKRGGSLTSWYSGFVNYYTRFLEVGLPFRSVHLDDLTRNPQKKLAELCEAVGLPYFEGKERFWERHYHHFEGSYGVYKQTVDKNSEIRASEDFPPEFEIFIPALSETIAQDTKVQQILETLKQAEMTSRGRFCPGDEKRLVARPYPSWYYAMKVREKLWRFYKWTWRTLNP
jgi:hypothetical protein